MIPSTENLAALLLHKNIRPSYQRIRVLECLHRNDSHPGVDAIYQMLSPEIPSLSKATIYNSLHLFINAGLVREVGIDEGEMRYDLHTSDHGHFKCTSCGTIFDFGIDIDQVPFSGLTSFEVTEKNVHFKGLCPNCVPQLQQERGKEWENTRN